MPRNLQLLISDMCSRLNVDGLRGDLVVNRAVKALVALEGRDQVTQQDVGRVISSCLNHRLRKDPLDPIDSGTKVQLLFKRLTDPEFVKREEAAKRKQEEAAKEEAKKNKKAGGFLRIQLVIYREANHMWILFTASDGTPHQQVYQVTQSIGVTLCKVLNWFCKEHLCTMIQTIALRPGSHAVSCKLCPKSLH